MNKPKLIDEYIESFPIDIQKRLRQMQKTVKSAAPTSEEVISYGMPALRLNGKILIYFAAFKNHTGVYPTSSGIIAFKKELKDYKTSKGAIQFPHDKPLPLSLIKKITEYRKKEVLE